MNQAKEHSFIQHQDIGTAFEGTYYVESTFIKQTVQKKDFTDMILRDSSGARNVKYWGRVDGVAKGDFVFVAANVEAYQGSPSIIAKNVEKVQTPDDLSDFIPVYEEERTNENASRFDEIRAQLNLVDTKIGNHTAGKIVDEVYKNSTFFAKFVVAPGNNRPHYGRQGGLLANIVRVAESAIRSADAYSLNDQERAVLISSALLSRIGAIEAFEFQDCMPVFTKKGILLGINNLTMSRISSVLKRVWAEAAKNNVEIDQDTVVRILHAVTAHDGSNVQPMTKEAMVLASAFQMDSQIVDALDFIESDTNKTEEFTAWNQTRSRKYYKGICAVRK